jgi:hypothetical protein
MQVRKTENCQNKSYNLHAHAAREGQQWPLMFVGWMGVIYTMDKEQFN